MERREPGSRPRPAAGGAVPGRGGHRPRPAPPRLPLRAAPGRPALPPPAFPAPCRAPARQRALTPPSRAPLTPSAADGGAQPAAGRDPAASAGTRPGGASRGPAALLGHRPRPPPCQPQPSRRARRSQPAPHPQACTLWMAELCVVCGQTHRKSELLSCSATEMCKI
nr:translation initiation factor IF-2-like [Pongo pygmaeus]